jgi:hypothetical protein
MSRPALGPIKPLMKRVPGASSLVLMRPGHKAYSLPPYTTEVKNMWSYTSPPTYISMEWFFITY